MRILRIIASADPRSGGPIEGALKTGAVWEKQGHQQDLLTLDPRDAPFLAAIPANIFPLGVPRGRMPWSRYGYAPGVVAWIKAHAADYDAIIVDGLWNYSVMAARRALVGGKTPYFVFTHGMLDPWFRRTYPIKHIAKQLFWLFNEGPLLRHAKAVLFTTEEERRVCANAFFPYRLNEHIVEYGTADVSGDPLAQAAAFNAALPAVAGRRFLLFLSRIHEKKGCDLLIAGFAGIAAKEPDLDLVIAGPDQVGLAAQLAAQARGLGIGDRVHFPGMLEGDAKWGAFHCCEAFVLTSHQENFGIVVAEAMACGKPVLISDKVNIWREVVDDGAGLVAPDTLAGSADLLRRFSDLPAGAKVAIGQRARASFLRRFTIDAAAASLFRTIQIDKNNQ